MIMLAFLPMVFGIINQDFFDQVGKEIKQGARWHHVGPQPVNPKAKSIPIQATVNGNPVGEPFIVWKLKLEK